MSRRYADHELTAEQIAARTLAEQAAGKAAVEKWACDPTAKRPRGNLHIRRAEARSRRKPLLAECKMPTVDEGYVPTADKDHVIVRHMLDSFRELAAMPARVRERLVEDLVVAGRYARAGVKAGKRHVSDQALGRHVFLADVRRAMVKAGLPVKHWAHDGDHTESFYFRMVHELAGVFGLYVPEALKLLVKQGAQIQQVEAVQSAEPVEQGPQRVDGVTVLPNKIREQLAADEVATIRFALSQRRQHLDQLGARLKASVGVQLAAGRRRLDDLADRLRAAA
jgi:hypothetical protein